MGNTHDDASRPRQQTPALSTSLPLNPEEQAVMNITQPIVRVLGELFSREDKKSIPPFKGKSTDKLITEWLKIAEHVARNNNWNDEQKIRFFSDRLKGEALEWHETYVEENDTNYDEWKAAIIERFQDAFDLAALKKKLFKLKQKPEENCRTFVSRLNNLYDTIEGKEEKLDDHDKTIMEDQLYNKVKRMRDSTKIKILLQGILPKVKTELYLRMPEKSDDFESLCKQLFISEQILHEKESNEDKEITAVIAGITTREKEQDSELTQQKIEIEQLRQKIKNLECFSKERELSQENSVTIAAADRYDNRRNQSVERQSRNSRVRFQDGRERSREPSYSRSREPSFSRSREASPNRRSYNRQEWRNNAPQRDRGRPYTRNYRQRRNEGFSRNSRPPYRRNNNRYSTEGRDDNRLDDWAPDIAGARAPRNRDIICHKCNKKGHIARECWTDMAHINHPTHQQM
ncbi:hypothetical protein GHT06_004555 [Daphnia sinensis]|uniref:CCHC-type domain-containing protein n=1 Tax=Daphnia sinensis TaxID=1820382 RepID=A0AAD5PN73_9CRUS|nr:hypothetical protein GHT06_004555 [Daphnia sinensis]